MIHHYIAKYKENEKTYVESWLQVNVFGCALCFSRRKYEIRESLMESGREFIQQSMKHIKKKLTPSQGK